MRKSGYRLKLTMNQKIIRNSYMRVIKKAIRDNYMGEKISVSLSSDPLHPKIKEDIKTKLEKSEWKVEFKCDPQFGGTYFVEIS